MVGHSILADLRMGLVWVALVGSIVLAIFLSVDFELIQREFHDGYDRIGVVHEVLDHVIFPVLVLLGPLAIAIRRLIDRSLGPLHAAAGRINEATGRERGFRVAVADFPEEAMPFADAVNALLSRLDDAARRQEGFAADVAHELKTPLAVAMLELERLENPVAVRAIDHLVAMNRLIGQLLVLAQLDAYASAPQSFQPVDIEDAAFEAIKLNAAHAVERGVALSYRDDGRVAVAGRVEALTIALCNLIENAVSATPAGGEVVVVSGPGPLVRVIDGGGGLAPDRLAELIDRFRRGGHDGSSGDLGLPIVARIVEIHGGSMTAHPEESSIKICFPRTVPA